MYVGHLAAWVDGRLVQTLAPGIKTLSTLVTSTSAVLVCCGVCVCVVMCICFHVC